MGRRRYVCCICLVIQSIRDLPNGADDRKAEHRGDKIRHSHRGVGEPWLGGYKLRFTSPIDDIDQATGEEVHYGAHEIAARPSGHAREIATTTALNNVRRCLARARSARRAPHGSIWCTLRRRIPRRGSDVSPECSTPPWTAGARRGQLRIVEYLVEDVGEVIGNARRWRQSEDWGRIHWLWEGGRPVILWRGGSLQRAILGGPVRSRVGPRGRLCWNVVRRLGSSTPQAGPAWSEDAAASAEARAT